MPLVDLYIALVEEFTLFYKRSHKFQENQQLQIMGSEAILAGSHFLNMNILFLQLIWEDKNNTIICRYDE